MRVLFVVLLTLLAIPVALGGDACRVWHESGPYHVCQIRFDDQFDGLKEMGTIESGAESRIRLVKFDGPIHAHQRDALIELGAEILDYLPRYAYILRMDPARHADVGRLAGLVTVIALPPVLKIGRDLTEALVAEQSSRVPLPLKISLWPGEQLAGTRERIAALSGLDIDFEQNGPRNQRLVVTISPDHKASVIAELARMEAVASMELHRQPVLLNSQAGWLHQSGTSGHTPVFDRGIYGCGQTIGVLDSGVDFGHCSFVDPDAAIPPISECDQGASCPAASPDPDQRTTSLYYMWSSSGSDLGDAACDPATGAGHGTHVAASAVGNQFSNPADCETGSTPGNLANQDGAAPGARLIAQEMGEGLEYLNQLGGGIYHAGSIAYAGGARIHNNSWGIPCSSNGSCNPGCTAYGALARDADFLAWDYPDLAVFSAVGNDGQTICAEQAGAPANAKNVFSIGSNQRGGSAENVSNFSSRGPIIDARIKPDMLAQGGGIRSAASSGNPLSESCSICTVSGTSMASPTAAGAAALVREYLERGFYPSGQESPSDAMNNPTSALVKAIMVNSARYLTGAGGGEGPNQNQGWGRITLDDALYFDGDDRRLFLDQSARALVTGDVLEYAFEVQTDQAFKATLAWTDYPAMAGAGIHLVNQLRLEVQSPDGQVWTQKLAQDDPDPFQSSSDSDFDQRNNIHQILFDDPQAGEYRIRVRAVHVPMGGGQAYALVVSGDLDGDQVPTFILGVDTGQLEVCTGNDAVFELDLLSISGFDDPVTLAIDQGLPEDADAIFSSNPVTPADPAATSDLTIDTASAATGIHDLVLSAESKPLAHEAVLRSLGLKLRIVSPVPSAADLTAPVDGATGVGLTPILKWNAVDQATAYRLQVATDPDFGDIIVDELINETMFQAPELDDDTGYYWRVAALNACGDGSFSEPAVFTTLAQFCSTADLVLPKGGSVADQIHIDASGYIGSVRVVIDLDFDWPGDLLVDLAHAESDRQIKLLNRPGVPGGPFGQGCGTPNVAVTLADGHPPAQDIANCSPAPPGLHGLLAPAMPVANLIGPPIEGHWILTIEDTQGLEADGLLQRWCVQLTIDPVSRVLFQDRFEDYES
jgi:subtilisin-like proprotein convertase family protein